ncbi:MAG: anaerobic ribonucleoside-triphosphate reductase activating protein [Lachnospiraceae bacterium]|nr:anaerobic ribonucleoside-triphosphate reductase activating protein [Lachnospiraceae bacterium]
MYFSEIKECDIANGPGVRVTVFVSGCTHHCNGCFNEMTWDFQYGREFTKEDMEKIIKLLEPSYIAGLTLLGGEPMEYVNQQGLLPLLRRVKEQYPDKTIWCYTGYLYDRDILDNFCGKWEETRELLSYLDVIVDGEFVEAQKDISLRFRGSSNQRIIDVKKSQEMGRTVMWEDEGESV